MQTQVIQVHPERPEPEVIARAAAILRTGGLVAFPTETVYGLGANALDAAAVARIFAAKGRPASNPVIVHVATVEAARALAAAWPEVAQRLAGRFWPGPLTLVLPKGPQVPDLVTAGGPTVALRVPAHPVALALIAAAGLPIAAPSANRSSQLSPTRAEHVLRGLDGRIDMLLDGGPTTGGLESTVLDLTSSPPRLLRPGLVSVKDLEGIVGVVASDGATQPGEPLRSPGLLARHYAPRTPLECVANGGQHVADLRSRGLRVGWLTFAEAAEEPGVVVLTMPDEPVGYAVQLYAALHTLDDIGVDRIVVDLPPQGERWLAIHDRLRRAAAPAA